MHSDVIGEVLHYFTRQGLEGLQILSSLLRDLIDKSKNTLPLRHIELVSLVSRWSSMTRCD